MNKKDRRKIRAVTGLLVLVLIVVGSFVSANAASAKLNKKKATVTVGKTVKLKVKNTGSKVKWTSSNKKVATVKKSGKYGAVVTGKKAGKATITARVGGKKLKCKVTVKKKSGSTSSSIATVYYQALVTKEWIELGSSMKTIPKGYSMKMKVTGGTINSVSSTKTSVLSIKKTGSKTAKITAKKAGKATIKIKVNGKTFKCPFYISADDDAIKLRENSKAFSKKIDVKISVSKQDSEGDKDLRSYFNIPDSIETFDTVTYTVTNNDTKSVKMVEAGVWYYPVLGKQYFEKTKKAFYDCDLRQAPSSENEQKRIKEFYRSLMATSDMKTITVNPGETKSITYNTSPSVTTRLNDYKVYSWRQIINAPVVDVYAVIKESPFGENKSPCTGYHFSPYTGKMDLWH